MGSFTLSAVRDRSGQKKIQSVPTLLASTDSGLGVVSGDPLSMGTRVVLGGIVIRMGPVDEVCENMANM